MDEQQILVVDDDREITRMVRGYLEQAGYAVLTAYNGESALQLLRAHRPDLVLLDLMLPDRDGWQITQIIRNDAQLASTYIIMLTARVEDSDKILGLELGADDYIPKPFNPREVLARVRAVFRRSRSGVTAMPAPTLQVGDLRLDVGRREVRLDEQPVELTRTEFSLLQALMQHPGYVFTRSELIEKSLGYNYEGLERTLDSHIKNLRRKLDGPALSAPEAHPAHKTAETTRHVQLQTVYGVGYRLVELP
jgi:two-component system, OmpR family, alkaline phosphatase synthesis response regulator PhoP